MQDLIPKNTGNSRFLRTSLPTGTSWASALAMLRAGTFPIDLAGINAAGVDQQGTPLNKGNLLADATETAIWGDADNRTVNLALLALSAAKLEFVQAYRTAGAYTWTCPVAGNYAVLIIGGGGSGAAASGAATAQAGGGAAGFANFYYVYFAKNATASLVVGAGGAAVTNSSAAVNGNNGGSSSFAGISANGGQGGTYSASTDVTGGQTPSRPGTYSVKAPYGGVSVAGYTSLDATPVYHGTPIPACFVDANGAPISMLCAGGAALASRNNSIFEGQQVIRLPNGKIASPGLAGEYVTLTGTTPTDPGAGGGGVANSSTANTIRSGKGADGLVAIYRVMGGAA